MAKFDKGQVGPHVDKLKELDGATSWCASQASSQSDFSEHAFFDNSV